MEYINFNKVIINDNTFKKRIETVNGITIRHAINKLYETPRIENFRNASRAKSGLSHGEFIGITFDDTDLYKIIEGAGYILSQIDDPELDGMIDELIYYIGEAQEHDGYITTRHTINPSLKWTCQDAHELYNFGHLIEGAIAHYYGTGKDSFLKIAIKAADYLVNHFKDENKWVPGHQEIELALIKLFEVTSNKEYLNLAHNFLSNRGKGLGVPNSEYSIFTENPIHLGYWDLPYHQDSVPIEYIHKVEGHAVRAMYMYTAMAMLLKHKDVNYMNALETVWDNLVHKNMYVTGGIGSSKHNEGFTHDYDLPNQSAYCETCASVGMVYWNSEMFLKTRDPKYLEIIEREMKNGIICGLSEDGTKFNYDNPLASDGSFERQEWFDCSCCPTQTIRFTPSIGKYIYAEDENNFYINLLLSSEYRDDTSYLTLKAEATNISIDTNISKQLKVYIPTQSLVVDCNHPYQIVGGFICFKDVNGPIEIKIANDLKFIHANSNVTENTNRVAIQYNGYIYCLEQIDCEDYEQFCIQNDYHYHLISKVIGTTTTTGIEVYNQNGELIATLIPYYLWNNRGKGQMDVWLRSNITQLYSY